MAVTMELIKQLRESSGAGIMECKKALSASDGDLEKARDYLRKRGAEVAAKKSGRATSEGAIGSYIHSNGKLGVLCEVQCETDFVARTEHFQTLMNDLCLHIAGTPYPPVAVTREQVPADLVEKEREIYTDQMRQQGKPDNIIEKIVDGKVGRWYSERVLLEQPFVKNPDQTIEERLQETIQKTGENLRIARFVRFALGE